MVKVFKKNKESTIIEKYVHLFQHEALIHRDDILWRELLNDSPSFSLYFSFGNIWKDIHLFMAIEYPFQENKYQMERSEEDAEIPVASSNKSWL